MRSRRPADSAAGRCSRSAGQTSTSRAPKSRCDGRRLTRGAGPFRCSAPCARSCLSKRPPRGSSGRVFVDRLGRERPARLARGRA